MTHASVTIHWNWTYGNSVSDLPISWQSSFLIFGLWPLGKNRWRIKVFTFEVSDFGTDLYQFLWTEQLFENKKKSFAVWKKSCSLSNCWLEFIFTLGAIRRNIGPICLIYIINLGLFVNCEMLVTSLEISFFW